jgi:hypothetical protein
MAGVETRDFDSPDETRTPDKTQVDVVRMGATTAARFEFEQRSAEEYAKVEAGTNRRPGRTRVARPERVCRVRERTRPRARRAGVMFLRPTDFACHDRRDEAEGGPAYRPTGGRDRVLP